VFGRLRQRLPTRHQPISNPRFSRALMFDFEVGVITVQVGAEGAGTGSSPKHH
jgi:hypothetical protein